MALSTKQKWFIGCGGCLGVTALLFALIMGGLFWFHSNSVSVVSRILGKEPAGFVTVLGVEPKKDETVGLLFSAETQELLFALKSPETPELKQLLASPDTTDPKQLAEVQKSVEATLSGARQTQRSIDSLKLEAAYSLKSGAATYKVLDVKVQNKKGQLFPAVILLAPRANKQVTMLALADFTAQTTDTQADFKIDYQDLGQSIATISQTLP